MFTSLAFKRESGEDVLRGALALPIPSPGPPFVSLY